MRWPSLVLGAIAMAVVVIAAWQIWDANWHEDPKWIETDRPNCQTWDPEPQRNETVSWTGGCQSGKADGAGVLTWHYTDREGNPLTETFSGTIVAGRGNGNVTIVFPGGDRYEGMFHDGQRDGHGVSTRANGARYDGEWRHDRPNGFGTLTEADGRRYDGQWTEGCLDKAGTLVWVDTDEESCRKVLGK